MKYEITDIRYVYNECHIPTAYFIAKDSFGFYFIKSVNVSGHSYTHYTRHYDYASALLHLQRDVQSFKPVEADKVCELNYRIRELNGQND